MSIKFLIIIFATATLSSCKTTSLPQKNQGGKAVSFGLGHELPEGARPNDNTYSLYLKRRLGFIDSRIHQNRMEVIQPAGNAEDFIFRTNPKSTVLEKELKEGYLLSYLYYEGGAVKYNGIVPSNRFNPSINNQTPLFSHSTGKSISSYILGHAICEGYLDSVDEVIDWPMMEDTLYHGQSLLKLLNMKAGDQHTWNYEENKIVGSSVHHRDMGFNKVAHYLRGSQVVGDQMHYNNMIPDLVMNYMSYRTNDRLKDLIQKIFQDKIKIANPVYLEKRPKSSLPSGVMDEYFGVPQTRYNSDFIMTRLDFLRTAKAIMVDYQKNNCIGRYLREVQKKSENWYKFKPLYDRESGDRFWLNYHAKKYGGWFYFNFLGLEDKNIIGTDGRNGQIMMIDPDNSRIIVVNSSSNSWDVNTLLLNVLKSGELPN